MKYGAVIAAAGLSSRMKQFKPLMEIDGMSMAQRIVRNFWQLGIHDIVVVTGYCGQKLESSLKGTGAVCIRNEQYATSQMFDSVKLGLNYMKGRCDAVFFTPVDVPLFGVETVKKLMEQKAGTVRIPVCDGFDGHPVCIQSDVIPAILCYQGNCGLRGALQLCNADVRRIPVANPGIFLDADTQEDFAELLKFYRKERFTHPAALYGSAGVG